MKQILYIMAMIALLFNGACEDDPQFPDPGFDMMTDKELTIRRDTAEEFLLQLKVNAPAGIDKIQILNGRDYSVLQELDEYSGQTEFIFQYPISFNNIEKSRDTVLIYTVRIMTVDKRAYNSSFKINLLKLSVPEITTPYNGIIGTTLPLVQATGEITTGMNTLESIKIYIDGTEQASVPKEEIQGLSVYSLNQIVPYEFEKDRDYTLRIEITDNKGQVHNEDLTVRGVELKKPKTIDVIERNSNIGTYTFTYDEQGRISTYNYTDIKYDYYHIAATFIYDAQGHVTTLDYDYTGSLLRVEYSYSEDGTLNRIVNKNVNTGKEYDIIQNIHYREDGTVSSFDAGITTFQEIQYADGFLPNEKLYIEKWAYNAGSMNLQARRKKSDIIAVAMPTYIEGLSPLALPLYIGDGFAELFLYKYIAMRDVPGYGNTESETTTFPEYSYVADENGQILEFTYKENSNSYYWTVYQFNY